MHLSEIKNRVLKLLRPPRQLRFTPEGTRFVIVALAIGVAAINTGNNLLYLILAMLLSMITLSGILSESSLRMVEIKRGLPKVAFAGKPFVVKITAVNNKRRLPSISLTFQDHMDEKREAGSRYFLKIPPNGSESGNYHFTLEGRGCTDSGLEGWRQSTLSAFFSNQRMPEKNQRYWYIREYWM